MVEEVTAGIGAGILEGYNILVQGMPGWAQNFVSLFLLIVLVFFYTLMVWKFYRFIATKNLLHLNLSQYNRSEHPVIMKLVAAFFYFLEYIIIVPFLVFFWYAAFTLFLIFLTDSLEIQALLIVSATIIGAIRMTSYYNQNLSKEVAKLLPFTLLAVAILDYTKIFNAERIFTQLSAIPDFFGSIAIYFLFILLLEIVLRFFDFLFIALGFEQEQPEEE